MKILITNTPSSEGYVIKTGARWSTSQSHISGEPFHVTFPFWMAYSASLLKRELPEDEIKIIDANALQLDFESYISKVKTINPEIVIIESSAISYRNDLVTAKIIREKFETKIAVVGPHATAISEDLLKKGYIDYVIRGEYELPLLKLITALKKDDGFEKIESLVYKKGDRIVVNPKAPLLKNLDYLPFPERDSLPMVNYNELFCLKSPNITLLSSRGCVYGCVFCSWTQVMYDHRYRMHSAQRVISEIEEIVEKWNPKMLFFDDDTFTLRGEKGIEELINLMKENGIDIPWACMGHPATVTKKMLKTMHDGGCIQMKFSMESGDPVILKKMKKGTSIEQIEKVFRWLKEVGIKSHSTSIVGLPWDTRESMRRTIALLKKINPDSAQISIATPLPGTEYYALAERKGLIRKSGSSIYDGLTGGGVDTFHLSGDEVAKIARSMMNEWYKYKLKQPSFILDEFYRLYQRYGILQTLKINLKRIPEVCRLMASG